jgi:small conductance mechanosensitive channel
MNPLRIGEYDLLSFLKPDSLFGALIYLVLFVVLAMLLSRGLRAAVHAAMTRQGHIDRTTISFIAQFGTALTWVIVLILYAHLIPELRAMGTALLAGASIASVVIGLAAQSTLGNLVAGVSITIYRPFRLGDTLQVAAPSGTETGVVELISLGYTTLRVFDGRAVVLPNALAASQVTINLGSSFAPAQMSIAIRIGRDADIEAARKLAMEVAKESAGENAISGCFLTRIDATAATLELKFRAPDAASQALLRSNLLAELSRRFARAGIGVSESEHASFA